MAKRPNPLVFALGLAVGIGGAVYFRTSAPPPLLPPASEVTAPEPAPPAAGPLPDDPVAREEAIRARRGPSELRYPIEAQYREVPSEVPHEVVAAYDESPAEGRGRRRLFVLAVAPGTSRDALARLVEDLRSAHLDADALRIQIYDSRVAATHPPQADVSRDPHLVGTYVRDGTAVRYELMGEPARSPR